MHYDLRLQFSESSTISFAIPYGLPGNANSLRPNRLAIETRVHNLWVGLAPIRNFWLHVPSVSKLLTRPTQNNLIESASHATGSLLIWDTGEYEILPRPRKSGRMTDEEMSDADDEHARTTLSHSERLSKAFQSRHIHIRLHGSRLPSGYTIALRRSADDKIKPGSGRPTRKRRRADPTEAASLAKRRAAPITDSETEEDNAEPASVDSTDVDIALASEDEEDATIRANNAYTGATNSIGSVHQRHWFLTLDRRYSGFHKARSGAEDGRWIGPWEPFYVRGREVERSVVTGRLAEDVMEDEGIQKFVGRKMWRPILE